MVHETCSLSTAVSLPSKRLVLLQWVEHILRHHLLSAPCENDFSCPRSCSCLHARDPRYVFDGYCGTSPKSRKNVRIITELAWQHHFAKNMFIRPASEAELVDFKPDYTIINACKVTNEDYKVGDRRLLDHVTCGVLRVTAISLGAGACVQVPPGSTRGPRHRL